MWQRKQTKMNNEQTYEIRRTDSGRTIVFCPNCDGLNNWLSARGVLRRVECTPVHYECDMCHRDDVRLHWREYRAVVRGA